MSASIDFAAAVEMAKRKWPELVHLRVAENEALCGRAGESRLIDLWGEYLTDMPAEVGCPKCVEWMHA